MDQVKAECIANELREVLRRHDAHLFIDGGGAWGEIVLRDGPMDRTSEGHNTVHQYDKGEYAIYATLG